MALKSGMDPRVLHKIFRTSTAGNTNCEKMNPILGLSPDAPQRHRYKGGFKIQCMVKDFGLAMQMAEMNGATLAMGDAGMVLYSGAPNDPRCRDLDSKVVYRYLGGNEDWAEDFQ